MPRTLRALAAAAAAVCTFALLLPSARTQTTSPVEAPSGYDGLTNGFVTQEQMDLDRAVFEARHAIADGLGPVYNAQACAECHQNPVSGAASQVSALRAGDYDGVSFVEHTGGSLINDRAIDVRYQERVLGGNTRALRIALSAAGGGFVECIANDTLIAIRDAQPADMRGQYVSVPVAEAPGALRGGRFGWKNQHASLLSMAAEEFLDQIGITSPLRPAENSSNGLPVSVVDTVPDPEDPLTGESPHGQAVEAVTRFLRATKAPPRDTAISRSPDAVAGSTLFNQIGCATCHVRNIVTAPPGTLINGGAFRVPDALGSKRIHPYSDFLLHNVGTGDGIVQNGGPTTRLKVRTAPLWGLRARGRLMHDGLSLTRQDAILRHAGEATAVTNSYRLLSTTQQNQLLTFLNSL